MIYSVLILKKTGETLYSKSIGSQKFDVDLTCGFISATFNFTQHAFGVVLEDIELGPYKILFEKGDDIILIALFDKYDSIINVREILKKLNVKIHQKYASNLKKYLCNTCEFKGLDEEIEQLIVESKKSVNEEVLKKYRQILREFRSSDEILDCDLISGTGLPLTKDWKEDFLELCLRMIDAFWKSQKYTLDQIILSYDQQRHLILYKVNEALILSALIRRNTPLGIATFLVEETAKKISKISGE